MCDILPHLVHRSNLQIVKLLLLKNGLYFFPSVDSSYINNRSIESCPFLFCLIACFLSITSPSNVIPQVDFYWSLLAKAIQLLPDSRHVSEKATFLQLYHSFINGSRFSQIWSWGWPHMVKLSSMVTLEFYHTLISISKEYLFLFIFQIWVIQALVDQLYCSALVYYLPNTVLQASTSLRWSAALKSELIALINTSLFSNILQAI